MGENIAGRIKSSESEHTARTLFFSKKKDETWRLNFCFFYFFRLKPLSLSFFLLPPSHTHIQLTPFPLLSLYRKKNKIGLGLWLFAFYIIKNKPSVTCVYINGNPNSLYTPAPLKENKTKKKLRFISSSSCISYFLSLSVCVSVSEGSDPTDWIQEVCACFLRCGRPPISCVRVILFVCLFVWLISIWKLPSSIWDPNPRLQRIAPMMII